MEVWERLEVGQGEEVGPQDHQVVLHLFGTLLLDDDATGTEVLIVEPWYLAMVLRHDRASIFAWAGS